MSKKLLETLVRHNEKEPRQDIMSIPTFELEESDKIVFHFLANTDGGFLRIQVENADEIDKSGVIERPRQIAEFYVINSAFYTIQKTGIYNFPIQNPFAGSGEIGTLKIFKQSATENEPNE